MNHLVYWVWLALRCGAGSELGSYLLKHFETPKDIYEATKEELMAIDGINESIAEALMDRSLVFSQKVVEYCERVNVGILTLESANYPERLRGIYAKPLVLYYKGKLPDIDHNVLIACVGTRSCSQGGLRNAYQLGKDLASAGAIVVSGMANGIDTAAQKGVLAVGGHTIAVLGCGIDRVYPPKNAELMDQIAKTGTVITEYVPGTDPHGKNFPIRNRIISGLSQGTVVVEADLRSGSLITANYAEKQGRDIFAFPGAPEAPHAKGTNALIRKGAKLVVCAEDVLEEYELLYPDRIFIENIAMRKQRRKTDPSEIEMLEAEAPSPEKREKKKHSLFKKKQNEDTPEKEVTTPVEEPRKKDESLCEDALERMILSVFENDMSVDEIAEAVSAKKGERCEIGEVLGHLTVLELEGFITAVPGGKYHRS